MKTNETELRSEAVIWAEGTIHSADDLVRLYGEYIRSCEETQTEPDDCQRFFNRVLGISNVSA
jgi:hypothetical protein